LSGVVKSESIEGEAGCVFPGWANGLDVSLTEVVEVDWGRWLRIGD